MLKPSKASRRAGFTLLEMIVACVLMAVLMTVVVRVLNVVLRESRDENYGNQAFVAEILAAQIRRDVTNARQYRFTPSRLELLGFVAQEQHTGKPLLTQAIASYRIQPTSEGTVLVREQRASVAASRSFTQPVWAGATSISFATSYVENDDRSGSTAEGGWLELPEIVELSVLGEQSRPLFSEMIVRREGS